MSIRETIAKALQESCASLVNKALQDAAASLTEETRKAQPLLVGNLHRSAMGPYTAYAEYGRSPVDLSNVVDSTATVIDESVKVLPSPGEV